MENIAIFLFLSHWQRCGGKLFHLYSAAFAVVKMRWCRRKKFIMPFPLRATARLSRGRRTTHEAENTLHVPWQIFYLSLGAPLTVETQLKEIFWLPLLLGPLIAELVQPPSAWISQYTPNDRSLPSLDKWGGSLYLPHWKFGSEIIYLHVGWGLVCQWDENMICSGYPDYGA